MLSFRNAPGACQWPMACLVVALLGVANSKVELIHTDGEEHGHSNPLSAHEEHGEGSYYTHSWAVHVHQSVPVSQVEEMAKSQGFVNNGKVLELDGHHVYEFHHADVQKQSPHRAHEHHKKLKDHPHVKHAEQQVAKVRRKRDFLSDRDTEGLVESARSRRSPSFNDPLWSKTWYLNKGSKGGYDMNVLGAWDQGYTGRNVVITILDDGIERTHPDLERNYDPGASFDVNNSTGGRVDRDPMPRYDRTNENRHGTRCAGEASAVANNGVCSTGAAYNSKIGGVRMLDGDVTDSVEARSLSLNPSHVDIYSSSWGPDDNGRTLDGPGPLAKKAFVDGVTKGRGGKGSIFVWASGNGGKSHDSCACDGYTNSPYTLSVSAVSDTNSRPWYLEECASTLASTFSSGRNYGQKKIVTTDLHHRCTEGHSGTSAAAPLAAGLLALALEANSKLTWRDMQYVVLLTANPEPLTDGQWTTNALGRKVSHLYGYGLMDAGKMTALAERWINVPAHLTQALPEVKEHINLNGDGLVRKITVPPCDPATNPRCVRHLESIQLVLSASYRRRGDLTLIVTSPLGTRSVLLPRRGLDSFSRPIAGWPFLSVHFWGENPVGVWTMELKNAGSASNKGKLTSYQLVLWGTSADPIANNCPSHMLMTNGDCVSACKREQYSDDSKRCFPCPANCRTCEDSSLGPVCTSCHKDHSLLHERTCVVSCPSGMISEYSRCVPCMENCLQCSPHSTATKRMCEKCASGYDLLGKHCFVQCPQGSYRDKSKECQSCHETCSTCTGPAANNCTLCKPPQWLFEGACYDGCPAKTFPAPVNHQECYRCHETCSSCWGQADNNCHSCPEPLTLTYLNKCVLVRNCSIGEFLQPHGACEPCHSSCKTCTGVSHADCTSCPDGRYMLGGQECVETCPVHHYPALDGPPSVPSKRLAHVDVETNNSASLETTGAAKASTTPTVTAAITAPSTSPSMAMVTSMVPMPDDNESATLWSCVPCAKELCLSCNSSACQACYDGVTRTADGSCNTSCASGLYKVQAEKDSRCQPCLVKGCDVCTDNGTRCARCANNLYLSAPYTPASPEAAEAATCVPECQPGWYGSSGPEGRVCKLCHPLCMECKGGASDECTRCYKGQFHTEGTCRDEPLCYEDQYLNTTTMVCLPCHPTCGSCSGPGPRACLTCPADPSGDPWAVRRRLLIGSGQCVACCFGGVTPDRAGPAGCCVCIGDMVDCRRHLPVPAPSPPAPPPRESHPTLITADLTIMPVIVVGIFLIIAIPMCVFVMLQLRARSSSFLCLCWEGSSETKDQAKLLYAPLATQDMDTFAET